MQKKTKMMPKTKIVCTLGPESRSVEMIAKLLKAGMNVARFNFSHGSHAYHQETIDNLRSAMQLTGISCAVMLDTKGPEIRTGLLKEEGKPIQLEQGKEITISTDYTIKGDVNQISMSYKKLAEDVKPGSVILCSDGTISFTVLSCDKENGLKKNVNLPGVVVDLPILTEKDKEDILKWGVPNHIDIIALSFVRKGSDLVQVRQLLGDHAKTIILMSKVENQEGVANFDDILKNTDAFMVARGDLGMEIPIDKIFLAQKMMIHKCNIAGKPVVTATQMLESMIKSPRPTRAEATDVANAVIDGTDCVMLSGETAAGGYPEIAVQTMARICAEAENTLNYDQVYKRAVLNAPKPMSVLESLACASVQTAFASKASVIIVLTKGGTTAQLVSKYRPNVPILSVVAPDVREDDLLLTNKDVFPVKHGLVYRGIVPVLLTTPAGVGSDYHCPEKATDFGIRCAKNKGFCKDGDTVVVLCNFGSPFLTTVNSV
ncbi:OLC1v1008925C1 [Oldenlandia corymbosa var. corymbosa]|uniref:Pyruvate kinase n=1 Tax=Oldenlandia corymbosa var. corymbosa TaxID=529605 RepID=A0AAV1DNA5_OLDCO|nr:OLC1v1008925C1 [Oldenlandia corymbosa var. corymbosa]